MDKPIEHYWQLRTEHLKPVLEKNHFEVFLAPRREDALRIVTEEILPAVKPASMSWGGSRTFVECGLYKQLREMAEVTVIDTYDTTLSDNEKMEQRRRALLVDLFFTSTNAVTESGHLVNLDMIGNRIAALTFGPRFVVVLVGRNKIVPDLEAAWDRIKNYAAPVNTMRLEKKTPCQATSFCQDCSSPDRICNTWTITEKAYPKQRVKIVLINEDLGF
jgi:L-lactate utilization protein LutC